MHILHGNSVSYYHRLKLKESIVSFIVPLFCFLISGYILVKFFSYGGYTFSYNRRSRSRKVPKFLECLMLSSSTQFLLSSCFTLLRIFPQDCFLLMAIISVLVPGIWAYTTMPSKRMQDY